MSHEIDINVCYHIVFESLAAGKGFQAITDALFEYTKMPIHVVDISFKIIAASYDKTIGSKHIDEMIQKKIVPPDVVILDYYRLGYIQKAESSPRSHVIDWGVVEVPQASGAIRIKGNMEGICATTFNSPSLMPIALKVNDILCKAFAIEMEREQQAIDRASDPIHQVIARELFREFLPESKPYKDMSIVDIGRLRPGYEIAIISPHVKNIRIKLIRNAIVDIFPNAYYIISGEYLYILFDGISKTIKSNQIIKEIESLVKKYQCYCGMSGLFQEINNKSNFFLRALKALEIGQIVNPDNNLYSFDDYYLEIIASGALLNLGEFSHQLPELENLFKEDMGEEHYNTLKTYLLNGNSISKTADQLHVHRNTLVYRLSKIKKITGLDINNLSVARRLLIAMTMQYINKAMAYREKPLPPDQINFGMVK